MEDGRRYAFMPGAFSECLSSAKLCWSHDRDHVLATDSMLLFDHEDGLRFVATLPPTADHEYEQVRTGVFGGMSLAGHWEPEDAYLKPGNILLIAKAQLFEVSPVVAGAQAEACVTALAATPDRDLEALRLLEASRFRELRDPSYRRSVRPRVFSGGPTVLETYLQQRERQRSQPQRQRILIATDCASGGMFG